MSLNHVGPPFYHVDRRGDLSIGDRLDLSWELEIYGKNESYNLDSQYKEMMREDFPRGLSAHGARYAHSYYEIDRNSEYYLENTLIPTPTPVSDGKHNCELIENGINEWLAERIRRDSFPGERSRLQSYFAWPNKDAIDTFDDESYSIFKVEPRDFDIRDMNLLNDIDGMQGYWAGKEAKNSNLEVVMHTPINIIAIC